MREGPYHIAPARYRWWAIAASAATVITLSTSLFPLHVSHADYSMPVANDVHSSCSEIKLNYTEWWVVDGIDSLIIPHGSLVSKVINSTTIKLGEYDDIPVDLIGLLGSNCHLALYYSNAIGDYWSSNFGRSLAGKGASPVAPNRLPT